MSATRLGALAFAALSLTGLYVLLRPPASGVPDVPAAAAPAASTSRTFTIDTAAPPAEPRLQVAQGEIVTLDVRSARAGELNVHGLQAQLQVGANGSGKLVFRADHAGRFPVHFHTADGAHHELADLIVQPR